MARKVVVSDYDQNIVLRRQAEAVHEIYLRPTSQILEIIRHTLDSPGLNFFSRFSDKSDGHAQKVTTSLISLGYRPLLRRYFSRCRSGHFFKNARSRVK